MRPFIFERADDRLAAVSAASRDGEGHTTAPVQFIAGGTTLLDLMKLDVMRPERLIDISSLQGDDLRVISAGADGLRIGALANMADVAADTDVQRDYPVVSESLELAASAQLRNMARIGGNLLQRTRCSYFRDTSWSCNKREPGSGCSAMGGVTRLHAVLGTSDACIASYPGDFAQALIALDATVGTIGPLGGRVIPIADLHREPGDTPHIETSLAPGELIVSVFIPAGAHARRSAYVKVRDRESYAFALASAAVALALEPDGSVRDVRIALGGLATRPWRAGQAEERLRGGRLEDADMNAAADVALSGARTHGGNAFKIELAKQTIVRALKQVRDMDT